jgi:uncharacterized membrane protein SirB2
MRTVPGSLDRFCSWLQNTPFSLTISSNAWIIPTLQTIHILSIALVISSVFLLYLQLAGLIRGGQTTAQAAHRFLPFIWGPLPVLLITGVLLISAEPARSLQNPSFMLKMVLLPIAIGVTLLFQRKLNRAPDYWDATAVHRATVKLIAVASLALWAGIVFAGRWIAYTQP